MPHPSGCSDRPDPTLARSPAEFVEAMRRLKYWSGLGFRRLEQRARMVGMALPRSTLTAALARDTLPREDLVATLARVCGCDEDEVQHWVSTRRRIAAAPAVPEPAPAPASAAEPVTVSVMVPAQLPPAVAGFAGRTAQMDALCALLAGVANDDSPPAVVITAIAGTAGVGKTALAIHWGHRVADRFPDGQLYLDLRGFDPSGSVMSPAEAVRMLLEALQAPAQRIPAGLDAQVARYRSLLAGKRVLVVLDNARDAEQVRPLLPGARGCLAVVTSRDQLAGLVATQGAHPISVDVMPVTEARELLAHRIGAHRTASEPEAVDEIIAGCAGLPLALAIVAARAALDTRTPLRAFAEELRDEQNRLDALHTGDPAADVRAVFSWSYEHLDTDAARLFRWLGLHPGADVTAHAAAALVDTGTGKAKQLLDALAGAHLVQATSLDRYRMHDLLRIWARERATTEDTERDRRAALTRLFDHYLHTARIAVDLLYPHERDRSPRIPVPAGFTSVLGEEESARSWLAAERANLLAVAAHTARSGWPNHAIELSGALHRHFNVSGEFATARTLHGHALTAAQRTGNQADQARTLHNLGTAIAGTGPFEQAVDHLRRALSLHRDLGNWMGQARALASLGTVGWRRGQYELAAVHLRQALALYREHGDPVGEARALANLSATCWRSGYYEQSAAHARQALTLSRALNMPEVQVLALISMAAAHWRTGRYPESTSLLHEALNLSRQTGDRWSESLALTHLGIVCGRTDRPEQATAHLRQAVTLWRDIGDQQGQADALTHLGDVYNRMTEHELAATCHRDALQLFHECGDQAGVAQASNGLGETAHATGDPNRSLQAHEHADHQASRIGDRQQLARAHAGAGHAQHLLGNRDKAHAHWRIALALYDELGVCEAAQLRAQLALLNSDPLT